MVTADARPMWADTGAANGRIPIVEEAGIIRGCAMAEAMT